MAINDIGGAPRRLPVIRGAEEEVKFIVDGKTVGGSWSKVKNFSVSPKVSETAVQYGGEPFETNDQQLHGYHLTWTNDQMDGSALAFLLDLQARAKAGLPPANVQVLVKDYYRDGTSRSNALFRENGVLSPQSRSWGSGKDYVSASWSFHCQEMSVRS